MRKSPIKALSSSLDKATLLLAIIASIVLLGMVVIVSTAVFARYFFNNPILGINEIVQLNAVALAMMALPYATMSGSHVRADIFDRFIGRWGRYFGDLLTRVLSIIALYVLVQRAWGKTLDAMEYGDATNMLDLPIWPFYGLIVVGMAICILIFAVQILKLVVCGPEPENV